MSTSPGVTANNVSGLERSLRGANFAGSAFAEVLQCFRLQALPILTLVSDVLTLASDVYVGAPHGARIF